MSNSTTYIAKIEKKGVACRGGSIFYESSGEWIEYTKKELESFQPGFEQWLKSEEKKEVFKKLQNLCSDKNNGAYRVVLGHKSDTNQIKRYENKYERAVRGEFSDELNAIIIEKHADAKSKIEYFVDMIEHFRECVDDMIENSELERAQNAIESARAFNSKTTIEDIKKLLT